MKENKGDLTVYAQLQGTPSSELKGNGQVTPTQNVLLILADRFNMIIRRG